MAERGEGWAWPQASRKVHYFLAGDIRSVCGGWMFSGPLEEVQSMGDKRGKDDCAACWKKASKRRG